MRENFSEDEESLDDDTEHESPAVVPTPPPAPAKRTSKGVATALQRWHGDCSGGGTGGRRRTGATTMTFKSTIHTPALLLFTACRTAPSLPDEGAWLTPFRPLRALLR